MATKNETQTEVKPEPPMTVNDIKAQFLPVLTGELFGEDYEVIEATRKFLAVWLDTLKTVAKTFDEGLVAARKVNPDLEKMEFFRKPREEKAKDKTSILDTLG